MIRSILGICAETILRDSDTNSMSAIQILEEIPAPGFPVLLSRIAVLFVLERDPTDPDESDAHFSVRVGNDELFAAPTAFRFQGQRKTRLVVRLNGLVIPGAGLLRVSLTQAGAELAVIQINVVHAPANAEFEQR